MTNPLRHEILTRMRTLNRRASSSVIATATAERLDRGAVWRELEAMWEDRLVVRPAEDRWLLAEPAPETQTTMEA